MCIKEDLVRLSTSLRSALVLLLGFASSSQADNICTGTIGGVFTDRTGRVMTYVTFRNDWVQVCNVTAAWKGVHVDICKNWVAALTTLRVTQEPVAMYYMDYPSGFACMSVPTYENAPSPPYISINVP